VQPKDLSEEAASAFEVYRWMGVSESAAMDLLRADGLVEESGVDESGVGGLAGSLGNIFGLSEAAARVASRGRGSVSEVAVRSSAGLQPGDGLRLVSKIEEVAAELCRRGVSEEKALREAAFAVFQAAPDDQTQEWVAQVMCRRWPGLWARPVSPGGGKGSSSGRMGGTVCG
jgi:hypothetical protein